MKMSKLSTFWIESYIKSLLRPLQKSTLGISWYHSEFLSSASKIPTASKYCFRLSIPYAKQNLLCEILFNPLYPEIGPEIMIDGEEFIQTYNFQSLSDNFYNFIQWKTTDNLLLVEILKEFLHFYKQSQIKILEKKIEKLHLEFLLLQDILGFENVEILVVNGSKQTEVKFLLKLQIDLSHISFSKEILSSDDILLFIQFYGPTLNRIIPELYLSPYLKTFFNNVESLHIPPLTELQHVADYTNEIKKIISNKICNLTHCMEERKKFIASLIVLQYESVIEYDVITYRRISLLFEHLELNFILNFTLPLNFPNEQFTLTMHSICHMMDQSKPNSKIIKNFPYSPRWEPKKMIIKVLDHIINKEIKLFQDYVFRNCS